MSVYNQVTLYGPKDSLASGDPNKVIHGSQIDAEFTAIHNATLDCASLSLGNTFTGSNAFSQSISVTGAGSSLKGAVTINTPASGIALTVNALAGAYGQVIQATSTNVAYLGLAGNGNASGTSDFMIGQDGSSVGLIFNRANAGINVATNGTVRMGIGAAGNFVINAPSSGTALSVTGLASAAALTVSSNSGGAYGLIATGTSGSAQNVLLAGISGFSNGFTVQYDGTQMQYTFNNGGVVIVNGNTSGPTFSATGNVTPASGQSIDLQYNAGGYLTAYDHTGGAATPLTLRGSTLDIYANTDLGSHVLSINVNGQITVNTPFAGNTLTVNGQNNYTAGVFQGGTTASQSFGLYVGAGTNASDTAVVVKNAAGSSTYFEVRGDGYVKAIDDGGTLQDVGWRGTPVISVGVNTTLGLSARGETIAPNTGGLTITVPSGVFAAGDVVTILVDSVIGSTTIAQGAGVTLKWAGNGSITGNRTLTGNGLATLLFMSASVAMISGAGLS